MGNITTTNRMAILDLIAQADETVEVTSIENRLTNLEDFINVDATSGYATFSASQSIVSSSTDGVTTSTQTITPISITGETDALNANVYIQAQYTTTEQTGKISSFIDGGGKAAIYLEAGDNNFSSSTYSLYTQNENSVSTSIAVGGTESAAIAISIPDNQILMRIGDYLGGGINYSENSISPYLQYMASVGTNNTPNTIVSDLRLDPLNVDEGTMFRVRNVDTGLLAKLELDPAGELNGNRLYSTDGTYETSISFDANGATFIDLVATGTNFVTSINVSENKSTLSSNDVSNSILSKIEASNEPGDPFIRIQSIDSANSNEGRIDITLATMSITSTDGTTTLSSVYDASLQTIVDTATDGTDTSSITIQPLGISFFTDDGVYEGSISSSKTSAIIQVEEKTVSKSRIDFTQNTSILKTEDLATGEYSQIDTTTTSAVISSTDTTWTTNVNVYPSNFEANTTDGTSDKWIGQDTTQVLIYSTDGTNQSTIDVYDNSMALSVTDGLTTTSITIGTVSIQLDNIPSYDDDSAAGTGGLTPGMIYMTTGGGANPLDVAGILMIKQ